ncbi:MAG: non-hydrolyzing UDP-N-acetylglucosamine 2-epimerase [Fervidobacterium gondwanense]|uniref:UDP-N-acetylglucosamine 2-epimerase (Non-hydrolysing) n=1 Tax=Fervidobacterium gondwanense DSM 13020 TaxID=1121883 RepID=A0A1M7RTF8_FERGO|nr:UDP-N-acetylglucosamine 2-epimerase (non-hydrolyzing) [Fervidobacterium gondwanense]SHN49322.1 UDP-N-acetylglucosamine 2-epimerase (non-hydrolysing) [Fervidobacterium gondwanense DSM 13020]
MKKLKVMTVVGTRPEIIRLSEIIKKLDESEAIEHIFVHTGQNYDYELNEVFFRDLELRKPDYFLNAAGENAVETVANILKNIDPVLEKEKPDAFLVLGDTNSCLSAYAAKRRHIPVFHYEAGNRCFDQRVPEEINRRIVDHIADINLTYSTISREYLIREGFPPDRVIKIGSPMYEVLMKNMPKIQKSDVLKRLGLEPGEYFVVSSHREENVDVDEKLLELADSINTIADIYKLPIIFSAHPRTRKRLEKKGIKFSELVRVLPALGFIDYVKLQMNAKCVLSDSGTISEETSILKLRALNIREAHERPEAMEEGTVMMVGVKKERILQGLAILENQSGESIQPVRDYFVPNVSEKVLRIILSYTDYVNRVVWLNR